MEQLYERHGDGTVTRELVPAREVAETWKSSTPFDAVMEAAGQEGLIEVNPMLVEGRPDDIRGDERVRRAYLGNMITGGRA